MVSKWVDGYFTSPTYKGCILGCNPLILTIDPSTPVDRDIRGPMPSNSRSTIIFGNFFPFQNECFTKELHKKRPGGQLPSHQEKNTALLSIESWVFNDGIPNSCLIFAIPLFLGTLRILGMSWGVKNTFFEAPVVSLGGSGVSIGGVKILSVVYIIPISTINRPRDCLL